MRFILIQLCCCILCYWQRFKDCKFQIYYCPNKPRLSFRICCVLFFLINNYFLLVDYKIVPSNHSSTENSKDQDALAFPNRPKRFFDELDEILNNSAQNMDRKFHHDTFQHQVRNSGIELQNSDEEEADASTRDLGKLVRFFFFIIMIH